MASPLDELMALYPNIDAMEDYCKRSIKAATSIRDKMERAIYGYNGVLDTLPVTRWKILEV
jgi:hypothetical protein